VVRTEAFTNHGEGLEDSVGSTFDTEPFSQLVEGEAVFALELLADGFPVDRAGDNHPSRSVGVVWRRQGAPETPVFDRLLLLLSLCRSARTHSNHLQSIYIIPY